MTRNPSSRFQVVVQPQALPAVCGVCGKPPGIRSGNASGPVVGQEIEFVDWGLSFDLYGALIFCEDCVKEVADIFGCASPEETAELRDQITVKDGQISLLETRIKELEDALANRVFDWARSITNSDTGNSANTGAAGHTSIPAEF